MTNDTKNVFISHVHEDDEGLGKLKDLVGSHGMTVRDYSIRADNPNNAHSEEYIKSEILAPRIQQSSTLVVYVSPTTKNSPWVDWEIEYAQKQDKRIIGVWAYGEQGCDLPDALRDYHDAVVGWSGSRIIDAINGKIDRWENPNGTEVAPRRVPRFSCR